ncbi:MAG TPA: OsmC family protein, partial [Gammaproteobacteria bacterium]|nr:OsmC family protein [Gammaproteobacteria bacterium]
MTTHQAVITWERGQQSFVDNHYSRAHRWQFDGGIEVPASSSPHVVPLPFSNENAVDPEEAFVASISSCHMLWFLSIAAKNKYCVDRYLDHAVGAMAKNSDGELYISEVTLKPVIQFSGAEVHADDIAAMHAEAHRKCFIANSVKTRITIAV